MKRQLAYVLLITTLLTGCSKSPDLFLTFASEQHVLSNGMSGNIGVAFSDTFAKDLCVIPVNNESEVDGNLSAKASFMFDITNQNVLYENNVYERLYPASITKIFSAYVVLKYADLDDVVTISKNAANITEPGAKLCGFKEGDTIDLSSLLSVFLIYSGNDAGVALAEHVSGTVEEFSQLMNETIEELGAVNSNFVNPHGLHSDDHYTTAYDIYLVFNELIKDDRFLDIIHTDTYTVTYHDASNTKIEKAFSTTNRYLLGKASTPEGLTVIGGKTGTTSKAGSCLVLYSKDKEENEYISLVLKAQSGDDLFNQMSYLLKLQNR